jgi:uncharacterized protein YaaN involved in tellurite resistance
MNAIDPNKPGLSIAVTPAPVGPASQAVAQAAQTPAGRDGLKCYDLLDGHAQLKATADAERDFSVLFNDTEALVVYGNDVLLPLNKLIDDARSQVPPVEIPELSGALTQLHHDMNALSGKYNMADPHVQKWLNDSLNGVKHGLALFGGVRSIFEELLWDSKNLYQKLDKLKAVVAPREIDATRNVRLLDVFYASNEAELLKLVYKIAVMEQIEALAEKAAGNIEVDPADPAAHDKSEKQRLLVDYGKNMETKISEFKGRMFLGWANGPQLTNKRTLNLALAVRLNMITNVSLPSVEFCVEQWEIALQEEQMANLIKMTDEFDNAVLTKAAEAGAQIAAFVADTTQTPSLRPETMKAIADSIAQQALATNQAYINGIVRRRAADQAMLDGQKVIASSQKSIADTFLNKQAAAAATATVEAKSDQDELLALAKGLPTAPAAA